MNIEQQEQNRTSTASTTTLESSSDLTTEINENSKHNLSDISPEQNIAFDSPISKELLGSVIIQKCPGVRTSARVIQKMKQDSVRCTSPPLHDRKDNKTEDKNLQKNTNQTKSASKNTWTNTEKNLFFDALNEYGKDFDAIHNFINSKIKKTSSNKSTKSKEQIRHSYYQTFHKLSKYIKFSDEIKKPAQELYALINYGEMRRKLAFVSEKNLMKIRELVYKGHVTVRSKGKSIRIKTPSCKALRKLNQLEDWLEDIKLPSKVEVCLRPATMEAWGRVQTIAQNPNVRTVLPLQKKLINLIKTFQFKWRSQETKMNETALKLFDNTSSSVTTTISATTSAMAASTTIPTAAASATSTSITMITTAAMTLNENSKCDKMNEGDQNLLQQQHQQQQQQLQQIYNLHQISVDEPLICLKPQTESVIHRPLVSITQYLSSFNICLNSYEEKIGVKIRSETLWQQDNRSHSKRQRTDSGCEKKNSPDNKKCKTDMNNINNDMSIIAAGTSSSSIIDNDNQDSKDETEDDLYSGEELIDDKYEKLDLDSSIEINSNNFDDGIRITTTTCNYENSQNNSNSAKTTCSLSSPSTSTSTSTSSVVIDSDNKTKKSNRRKDKNLNKLQNNLKPFINDKIIKKIRRGWTILNAADITVGDLYIVFGQDAKLMFEYCWLNEKRPEFDITHISNIVPYNLTLSGQQQHQYQQQQLQLQHQQQQSQQQQQQQVHLQQQKQQHKADKALIDKLNHESLSNKLKHLLLIANLSERIKRKQCTCGHICGSKFRLENESTAKSFVSDITYSGSHTDINVFRQPVLPLRRTLAVQSFKQIPNGHRIKQSKFLRTGKIGSRKIFVQRLLPVQPGINQSYDVLAPQLEIRTLQDDSTNISNATTATTTTTVANTTNQNTTSSNTTTVTTVDSNVSTNNESNTISSTTVNELKQIELNNLIKNNTKANDVNNILDNNNYEIVMENNENSFKEEIFSSPSSTTNSSPSPSTSVTVTVSDCIEKSDENSLLNAINYNDNENCLNILKSNNSTTGNNNNNKNNNNNNNNNDRHNNGSINNNQDTTTLEDSDLNPLLDLSIPSPLPITSLDDNTNDTITSIPPMSPMQLLRETNADSTKWLNDSIDFSLTSFLGHLEEINNRNDTMDNANISVISESSVDYVSKFAEIASMQNEERDL